ncbi:MAG: DUF1800 domain-containing protein [Candidatus Kapabacteria bacterium]|nr:DUF1800 domain-containing protein [Candidatus Kapabacteria bacterium]
MNRRSFFSFITDGSAHRTTQSATEEHDSSRAAIISSLDPYTTPLTRSDAMHLLRRLAFAPTIGIVNQITGKRADEAVEMLLGTGGQSETPPPSPGPWVDVAQEDPNNLDVITRGNVEGTWRNNFANLQTWWIDQMRTEQLPLREKLTLFWSGHFTSEFTYDLGYIPPQLLYRQNLMFRKDRIASFPQFVEDVTLDAAMLEYLGGTLNVKGKPNENYARELMELYTCGIGNYSEADVQQAARVLTGWKASMYSDAPAPNGLFNTYFIARDHDTEGKVFMNNTIPARPNDTNTEFLVRTEEVRGLINLLLKERPDATARFMARKIYRYFVYSNPGGADATFVNNLADLFKQSNFELRPVIKALFSSAHFFAAENRGVQIKTPAEYVVGLGRQLGVSLSGAGGAMKLMEQDLIDPPNVSGWDGYRTWINTKTFPQRVSFGQSVVKAMTDAQAQSFVKQFADFSDVNKFMRGLEEYFLPVAVSNERHTNYVNILLSGSPDYEWGGIVNDAAAVGTRLRGFLNVLIKAPDFHLC